MFFTTKQFGKEISALKSVPQEDVLHPLRREQIKQRILQRVQSETNLLPVRSTWQDPTSQPHRRTRRKRKIMQIIISILTSLGLLGGTAFASISATPGDMLYPVKRVVEKAQVAITVSEESKAALTAKHAEERIEELGRVKAEVGVTVQGNSAQTELKTKTEIEARAEVSNALKALTEVQAKLEADHNTQAAASVSANIARLEAKAMAEDIIKKTNDIIKDVQKHIETEVQSNGKPVQIEVSGSNGTNKVEVNSKSSTGQSYVEVRVNSNTNSKTNIVIDANSGSKIEIK